MTFAPNNLAEIEAMRALTKAKPVVSRAEQAEIIRNRIEGLVANALECGFTVAVGLSGVVVWETHK